MPTEQALPQTRLLVQAAATVCEDKKGQDTRILELDPVDAGLSDFFLVTSATNDRQAIDPGTQHSWPNRHALSILGREARNPHADSWSDGPW